MTWLGLSGWNEITWSYIQVCTEYCCFIAVVTGKSVTLWCSHFDLICSTNISNGNLEVQSLDVADMFETCQMAWKTMDVYIVVYAYKEHAHIVWCLILWFTFWLYILQLDKFFLFHPISIILFDTSSMWTPTMSILWLHSIEEWRYLVMICQLLILVNTYSTRLLYQVLNKDFEEASTLTDCHSVLDLVYNVTRQELITSGVDGVKVQEMCSWSLYSKYSKVVFVYLLVNCSSGHTNYLQIALARSQQQCHILLCSWGLYSVVSVCVLYMHMLALVRSRAIVTTLHVVIEYWNRTNSFGGDLGKL